MPTSNTESRPNWPRVRNCGRNWQRLRRCLEPLESVWEDRDPPPGLVDRVCESIDAYDAASAALRRAACPACARPPASALQRYSVSDSIVLTLVVLIAFTLLFPALANSRYQARKTACHENLWTLGQGLFSYSDLQSDRFPLVPISGSRSFAGVFAPILLEHELLPPKSPPLICPGSELAAQARRLVAARPAGDRSSGRPPAASSAKPCGRQLCVLRGVS